MARTVKSAVRVLQVLELFDRLQREVALGEIARERPLLSTMADEQVRYCVVRPNAGAQREQQVNPAALKRELGALRARRYSAVLQGVTPGAGLMNERT